MDYLYRFMKVANKLPSRIHDGPLPAPYEDDYYTELIESYDEDQLRNAIILCAPQGVAVDSLMKKSPSTLSHYFTHWVHDDTTLQEALARCAHFKFESPYSVYNGNVKETVDAIDRLGVTLPFKFVAIESTLHAALLHGWVGPPGLSSSVVGCTFFQDLKYNIDFLKRNDFYGEKHLEEYAATLEEATSDGAHRYHISTHVCGGGIQRLSERCRMHGLLAMRLGGTFIGSNFRRSSIAEEEVPSADRAIRKLLDSGYDVLETDRKAASSFLATMGDIAILQSKDNLVVEQIRKGKQRKTKWEHPRRANAPTFIVLPRKRVAEKLAAHHDDKEIITRSAHWRRRHWRHLTSERYKEKRGKWIQVREHWVGPKEWKADGCTYKVRIDL